VTMLSVVVVNWNTRNILFKCLQLLEKERVDEIIVVDNASSDGSVMMLKDHFEGIHVIENKKNVGFAKAANVGIRYSSGNLILLINSDIFVKKGAIEQIKRFMENNMDVEISSPLLYSEDGEEIENHRPIPNLTYMLLNYSFALRLFPFLIVFVPKYLQGAALVFRKTFFKKVGLLDERFFFYAEDVDLCLRTKKKGLKIGIIPTAKAVHLCGGSSKRVSKEKYYLKNIESNLQLFEKYYPKLVNFFIKKLIITHFAIRNIFNSFISLSYVDGKEIEKKMCFYRQIMDICRK